MSRSLVWILGKGGFLGSALVDECNRRGYTVFNSYPISWPEPQSRLSQFRRNLHDFVRQQHDGRRIIIWAAGESGVGGEEKSIDREFETFSDFVSVLTEIAGATGVSFYLCSSAGGVYAKSQQPPFDSLTVPAPQSHYGEMKLAMENLATNSIAPNTPVTIGRISNLYGPWIGTRQGLINRLCRAALERSALNLFVPMGTMRDYLYISDAAQLIMASQPSSIASSTVEVIASGISATVAQAISTVSSVAHRKVPVSIGTDKIASEQPEDLRLTPSWHHTNPSFTPIDLATGSQRVLTYLTTISRSSHPFNA